MRTCIFCGGRANSKEDVWPQWIMRSLQAGRDPIRGGNATRTVTIPGPQARVKVRNVCQTRCNNGWMSRLEGAAKPIMLPLMEGKTTVLPSQSQQTIAQWFVKTIMVYEHLGIRVFYSQAEREAMMNSLAIPPRTLVWIGRCSNLQTSLMAGIEMGRQEGPPEGVVYTMAFDHLVIQALTIRTSKRVRIPLTPDKWQLLLGQVWPVRTPVRWPPPLSFSGPGERPLRVLVERVAPGQPLESPVPY